MGEALQKTYNIYKENGIVHCLYQEGVIMDLDFIIEAIDARISAAGGIPCPIFIDGRGVKYYTLEARKYGASEKASKDATSYAILINSNITKTIVNWSVKYYPPKGAPVRMFTDKDKALQWLEQFKG